MSTNLKYWKFFILNYFMNFLFNYPQKHARINACLIIFLFIWFSFKKVFYSFKSVALTIFYSRKDVSIKVSFILKQYLSTLTILTLIVACNPIFAWCSYFLMFNLFIYLFHSFDKLHDLCSTYYLIILYCLHLCRNVKEF